jgi:nitrite reductase/ring-hydroxylating ferredoxin subunit
MPKTPIHKNPTPSANTQADWWPAETRMVCAVADMPENGARGFTLTGADKNQRLDIIIWLTRNGREAVLRGFVNKCPHMGLPLETFPDRFLSADGERLICSAHGAQFDFDGACFAGPCKGAHLYPLDLGIENGVIILPPQNPPQK